MNQLSTPKTAFPGTRVLVVDDEPAQLLTLGDFLEEVGYEVTRAPSGVTALEYLTERRFDAAILDLKMPDIHGTQVLRLMQSLAPETITIILTAYGTMDAAIAGIRYGAFDFLHKPSSVQEIVQAIEAGLSKRRDTESRRSDPLSSIEQALLDLRHRKDDAAVPEIPDRFLHIDGLVVDLRRHHVLVNNQPVDLTPTEYDILTYLMQHPDRIVPAQEIVYHLRGYEIDEAEAREFLSSHLYRLRGKIEPEPGDPRYIVTIRGRGYCLPTDPGVLPAS
jgi:DNA-binding response OmpR family regulator